MIVNEPIPIWENVMIDIETLGTKPGAVIASIAAVGFDIKTGSRQKIFHERIDIVQAQHVFGLHVDASTVKWWLVQSQEAMNDLMGNARIDDVLLSFNSVIRNKCKDRVCQFWANSPSFDFRLLEAAMDKTRGCLPWQYFQEMDVRTIAAMRPEIKLEVCAKPEYKQFAHTALSDCYMQIEYVCRIWNEINKPQQ